MKEALVALILSIAPMYDVPPYLVVAIAEVESNWNVNATNQNKDGTVDRGLLQLNSSWFRHTEWTNPSINIYYGFEHLQWLRSQTDSWWAATVAYNCGLSRLSNPPDKSVSYAVKVYETWERYAPHEHKRYIGR
jgi:soluble lytic murein transglycosylase-like protein